MRQHFIILVTNLYNWHFQLEALTAILLMIKAFLGGLTLNIMTFLSFETQGNHTAVSLCFLSQPSTLHNNR